MRCTILPDYQDRIVRFRDSRSSNTIAFLDLNIGGLKIRTVSPMCCQSGIPVFDPRKEFQPVRVQATVRLRRTPGHINICAADCYVLYADGHLSHSSSPLPSMRHRNLLRGSSAWRDWLNVLIEPEYVGRIIL